MVVSAITSPANTASIAFHRAMGFEVRGPVPDYDGPGLDRIVFERGLWTRLETDRLVLREFVADDEAAVHEYASDPEVTRLASWGPNTIEQTREFLAQITQPHGRVGFAITLHSTGKLVGSIGIGSCSDEHRRGELGYVINRAHWSRGYATEATRRIVQFRI